MSQDAQVPSNRNVNEQEVRKSVDEETYDPRDLVIKPGYAATQNVDELIDNPAVTPEMPNNSRGENNRRDLKDDKQL